MFKIIIWLKFFRFVIVIMGLAQVCTAITTTAQPQIPNPVLRYNGAASGQEGNMPVLIQRLMITNWDQFPAAMFAPAPARIPCRPLQYCSRTTLSLYRQDNQGLLHTYNSFKSPEDMKLFEYKVSKNDTNSPKEVFVVLTDRVTGKKYPSNCWNVVTGGPCRNAAEDFPNPQIKASYKMIGQPPNMYSQINGEVLNWQVYPSAWVKPALGLSKCNNSTSGSRVMREIIINGTTMSTFCNFTAPEQLKFFSYNVLTWELTSQEKVSVVFTDRLTNKKYQSNCATPGGNSCQ